MIVGIVVRTEEIGLMKNDGFWHSTPFGRRQPDTGGKEKPPQAIVRLRRPGAPKGTRTPSIMPRKHALYPIELWAHQRDVLYTFRPAPSRGDFPERHRPARRGNTRGRRIFCLYSGTGLIIMKKTIRATGFGRRGIERVSL